MQIGPVQTSTADGTVEAQAQITWEGSPRPPLAATMRVQQGAGPVPAEAFVAATAVVADLHGERCLSVADAVDPGLVGNLTVALATLRSWYGSTGPPLRWATTDRQPTPASGTTAFLMSGGVDSTALLVDNHRRLPPGHPWRIKAGVVVYGLDESTAGDVAAPDAFLTELAVAAGIELVPVATNLRELDLDWKVWQKRSQMAVLTGAAHATGLKGRLLVAASDDLGHLRPYGTHPLLDPLLGSAELQVHHEIVHMTRGERVGLVAGWPPALAHLQVCNRPRRDWAPDGLNCGRCEKCLRTLVSLRAAGVLDPPTFPGASVTAAAIDDLHFDPALLINWASPEELRAGGEHGLAASVARLPRRLRAERLGAKARATARRAGGRLGLR